MAEEWRPLPGWEETYEVSSLSRIRSLDRFVRCAGSPGRDHRREVKGRILKQIVGARGYLSVLLKDAERGKSKRMRVHRAVAIAFIPSENGRPYVNHIDHNKLNNAIENLEWCTHAENLQHAARAGRLSHDRIKGVLNPRAKLTEPDVVEIKRRLRQGHTTSGIARDYCVIQSTISNIKTGRTWKHIAATTIKNKGREQCRRLLRGTVIITQRQW